MKLLLLSDLHLMWDRPRGRIDNVGKTSFRKMDFVLDSAAKIKAVILQAGDFFNVPRSWHMLVAYVRLFDIYRDVSIYCIFGQHDQYFRSRKDTLLDALSAAGYVKILGKEPVILRSGKGQIGIYGCGYGEEVPDTIIKKQSSSDCDVLVAHRMILAKRLWPGQDDYVPAERFLRRHKNYDLILCGDAHQKFEVGEERQFDERRSIICNSGPMMRVSADLWDHKPGFWIYDTDDWSIEWVEIPREPPERCMTRRHLEEAKETEGMLKDFVDAIKAIHPEIERTERSYNRFRNNLAKFIEKNDISNNIIDIISEVMVKKEE